MRKRMLWGGLMVMVLALSSCFQASGYTPVTPAGQAIKTAEAVAQPVLHRAIDTRCAACCRLGAGNLVQQASEAYFTTPAGNTLVTHCIPCPGEG